MHAAGLASAGRVLVRSVGRGFLVAVEVEGCRHGYSVTMPIGRWMQPFSLTRAHACLTRPDSGLVLIRD